MLRQALQTIVKNILVRRNNSQWNSEHQQQKIKKKNFTQRLEVINKDHEYPLNNLEPLEIFEDNLSFELMNSPRVITKGGFAIDENELTNFINADKHFFYKGEKLILLPADFDVEKQQSRVDELLIQLKTNPMDQDKESWLNELTNIQDQLIVYNLQNELTAQLDEYISNQETVYASWNAIKRYEAEFSENILNLLDTLERENLPEVKIDTIIAEQFNEANALIPFKKKLCQDLLKFIEDTAYVILTSPLITHSEEKTPDEKVRILTKKEELMLTEVLTRPLELYMKLNKEIKSFDRIANYTRIIKLIVSPQMKAHFKLNSFGTSLQPYSSFNLFKRSQPSQSSFINDDRSSLPRMKMGSDDTLD